MNDKIVYGALAVAFATGWIHAALEQAAQRAPEAPAAFHAADCGTHLQSTNHIPTGTQAP